MTINGKEIGFLFNVGAYCDYSDWVVANKSASVASAQLVKAEYMSRAWAAEHNSKDYLTVAELRKMMPYELEEILKAVEAAEKAGSQRQIETVDTGKKTVKTS